MKYCSHCGTQLPNDAAFCSTCGKAVYNGEQQNARPYAQNVRQNDYETMKTVINVFLILACVIMGIATFGIALAWCVPMTLKIRERMRAGVPVGIALKVCTLIFVSTVAGILLLVLQDGSN